MRLGWRRIVLLCLALAGAIVVLVPGGSAGNRTADATFAAFPGTYFDPATQQNRRPQVTYGENIAYRATFANLSGSTFTHVIFRMEVPHVVGAGEARLVTSTCPVNDGLGVTVPLSGGGSEWQCDYGTVRPSAEEGPQLVLSVVWLVPQELAQKNDCTGCLVTTGRWAVKEGGNDNSGSQPNDTFGETTVAATLLAAESKDVPDSADTTMAGGYEIEACTDAFGSGSLRTKPTLDPMSNSVSTTVCIPTIPTDATDSGLATTILEGPSQPGDPGHATLGRSDVCVAMLGTNCGPFGTYVPQDFGTDEPLTLVFRIADAALDNGDKITQVFHNGAPLPSCSTNPTNGNGCTDLLERSGGRVKIWTIVVKSRTNGFFNW